MHDSSEWQYIVEARWVRQLRSNREREKRGKRAVSRSMQSVIFYSFCLHIDLVIRREYALFHGQ